MRACTKKFKAAAFRAVPASAWRLARMPVAESIPPPPSASSASASTSAAPPPAPPPAASRSSSSTSSRSQMPPSAPSMTRPQAAGRGRPPPGRSVGVSSSPSKAMSTNTRAAPLAPSMKRPQVGGRPPPGRPTSGSSSSLMTTSTTTPAAALHSRMAPPAPSMTRPHFGGRPPPGRRFMSASSTPPRLPAKRPNSLVEHVFGRPASHRGAQAPPPKRPRGRPLPGPGPGMQRVSVTPGLRRPPQVPGGHDRSAQMPAGGSGTMHKPAVVFHHQMYVPDTGGSHGHPPQPQGAHYPTGATGHGHAGVYHGPGGPMCAHRVFNPRASALPPPPPPPPSAPVSAIPSVIPRMLPGAGAGGPRRVALPHMHTYVGSALHLQQQAAVAQRLVRPGGFSDARTIAAVQAASQGILADLNSVRATQVPTAAAVARDILSFVCRFCERVFPSTAKLAVHEADHDAERPYECRTCGRMFASEFHWRRHKTSHDEREKIVHLCDYIGCTRAFPASKNLKQHKVFDHGNFSFKCTECDAYFRRPWAIRRHFRRAHPEILLDSSTGYDTTQCMEDEVFEKPISDQFWTVPETPSSTLPSEQSVNGHRHPSGEPGGVSMSDAPAAVAVKPPPRDGGASGDMASLLAAAVAPPPGDDAVCIAPPTSDDAVPVAPPPSDNAVDIASSPSDPAVSIAPPPDGGDADMDTAPSPPGGPSPPSPARGSSLSARMHTAPSSVDTKPFSVAPPVPVVQGALVISLPDLDAIKPPV